MKVRFACPECETETVLDSPSASDWRCACGHSRQLTLPPSMDEPVKQCVACGCNQLFRQKNFPQWLGLSLLTAACSLFFILQGLYLPRPAWIILLGSAAFDLVLYFIVGDVIVCYRCQAKHHGVVRQKSYDPFELPIAEKYRQERIRRELAGKS